jgi:hypothetical protein
MQARRDRPQPAERTAADRQRSQDGQAITADDRSAPSQIQGEEKGQRCRVTHIEAVTKAPVTASKAGKPTLDPLAWSRSSPQEREAFIKAVGWSDIDDIINALEPRRRFDTLKQAWNAATPAERKAFATEYRTEINTLGWKQWG